MGKPGRPPGPGEAAIQREVLRYLHARGILAWKAGSGAIRLAYKDKMRYAVFGKVGQADIIGLLPGGRFLAVEIKRDTGRLTIGQRIFLEDVAKRGGAAMVVRSVAECHALLTPLLGGSHGATEPVVGTPAPVGGHDRRAGRPETGGRVPG